MLGSQVQMGQALHRSASCSVGLRTTISFTVGMTFFSCQIENNVRVCTLEKAPL
jgi:hypothetical protein